MQHRLIHLLECRCLFLSSLMMVAGLTCNTRAVSRIPTVPIAMLAFRRRAMAHNIRALAVGAWSTCVIIVARYHTGGSVPLRHPSRMADQQLCNTFPKRNPGRRSMTSVLPRSTSPLMAPSCQRVSPATSVKEPPRRCPPSSAACPDRAPPRSAGLQPRRRGVRGGPAPGGRRGRRRGVKSTLNFLSALRTSTKKG